MANRYKTIKERSSTQLDGFQGGHFSKSTVIEGIDELYTDPTKKDIKNLLPNLINKAVAMGLDHSDFPLCNLEEFLEDYITGNSNTGNIIEIDCKVDMAIPKEDLEKNLQLLIDRHGVQEVSNLLEKVQEVGFHSTLKLL